MTRTRRLSVVFCDDIRVEVGGKHSYIGVYGTTIDSREFPLKFASFAVAITIEMPVSDPLTSLEVEFEIVSDDGATTLIGKSPVDLSGLNAEAAHASGMEFVAQNVMATFGGITFQQPSTFRVAVRMDDGVAHTRQIRIRQVDGVG
ncbi:DUF6941 family protein [Lysobacter korlensis]|uniref:DUF6941 family protein n=1 Tax=Lysobacter korlensis TaxID=553636 RepID=A0ABV6RL22_9GAMM